MIDSKNTHFFKAREGFSAGQGIMLQNLVLSNIPKYSASPFTVHHHRKPCVIS